MPWEAHMALGVADMDATHREFVELLEALRGADDASFPGQFAQLREHTRLHFEHEGRLMKSCRFPATGEHNSEHLRVLGEMAQLSRSVAAGRLMAARSYVAGLPGWFSTHLQTMDAALAARLKATTAA
ncbi:MAG: hemerythrin domain-containing protein [Azonexaceae bacterium]|uniref:bacteriohemerythrin n=1 Tax=Azonexus sp. R2A61 TaxID=2744443 RepID=UPI001F26CF8B|nr:hemerythrin domain-containing protein [Azonexus sp. R2A61]MCE1240211.1 hemerythrin domain-containing protein [Azonexaceae bacterium]